MSENKDYIVENVEKGSVNISEEVVSAIAAVAVSEVEGVVGLSSGFTADLAEMLGKKNLSKGVKLSIVDSVVTIESNVIVMYGSEIPSVANAIQENVISAVESMTGLKVQAVNINVCGISAK